MAAVRRLADRMRGCAGSLSPPTADVAFYVLCITNGSPLVPESTSFRLYSKWLYYLVTYVSMLLLARLEYYVLLFFLFYFSSEDL